MKTALRFIIALFIPLAIGGLSGFFTADGVTGEWFTNLVKPSFNPPNYLFGPVWTALYALMGVSFFLVLGAPKGENRSNAILAFVMQLILNFWWSIFFFNFERPDIALGEIALLWLAIVYMIYTFYKVMPGSGLLQIPYLLWVSFASALNASFWLLNK
ncbi:MAG: tryptophan-rich sensory protein [Chitinophagales bacterium]|nr:tryptophan-rich sensory protein [Chitinophagales bacterium]